MLVRRSKLKEAIQACEKLVEECNKLKQMSYLVGIDQHGRKNTFYFSRNGEIITLETFSVMGDDVEKWRKDLLK